MLKKFIKEAIVLAAGKPAEVLVDLLSDTKYANEFLIAKKINLTINQTRNLLYKISDYGLVSSIRKKDKRKGWYTYFWKIETLKSLEFLKGFLIKKINQMESQIKSRETKEFYVCEKCNIEFNEENALLHDFTCNECGNVFALKDNAPLLKELRKNRDKNKQELNLLEQEIQKEKEKTDKKKIKELKKEKKEKESKRLKKEKTKPRKKISKPKKKITNRKTPKKSAKKKISKKSGHKRSFKKKKQIRWKTKK